MNIPDYLWFHAIAFGNLVKNSVTNATNKFSPRARAGLLGLDASTILPFGHEVMVYNTNQQSKLDDRGMTGFASRPLEVSHGYLIYIPSRHTVIDTANYKLIKLNNSVSTSEETSKIFYPLLEQLSKHAILSTTNHTHYKSTIFHLQEKSVKKKKFYYLLPKYHQCLQMFHNPLLPLLHI